MNVDRLIRPPYYGGSFRLKLLVVCFFFLFGAVGGLWLHSAVTAQDDQILKEYLLQYAHVFSSTDVGAMSILTAFAIYCRYPMAVFACRMLVPGLVLAPWICCLQGATLSFAVCSFLSAIGREGFTLALAALGLRYFITLPCTFYLAALSLNPSSGKQPRKKAEKKNKGPKEPVRTLFNITPFLLIGIVAELLFVPKLISLALSRIT